MKSIAGSRAQMLHWSRPARGAWIEIFPRRVRRRRNQSRPARGAWIEIQFPAHVHVPEKVAPRKGRVD